jgi:type III pantothenate kinase
MLLALDIGNTNTVVGAYGDEGLAAVWRLQTDRKATGDDLSLSVEGLLRARGIASREIDAVAVASVVPPLNDAVKKMSASLFGVEPFFIEGDSAVTPRIRYNPPSDVGPDRIANAVAAAKKYGTPVIIVDFGTATTVDAVSGDGSYVGGAIAPGVRISTEALTALTSRLPRVETKAPPKAIGTSTVESMQSGIVFGFAGQVKELVSRVKTELGGNPKVIATGGLADLIAPECGVVDEIDPDLTLEGIRLIWESARSDR